MSLRTSLVRTLAFAGLYLLATYAGRLTVMDSTNLSLVWPAAGISAVWFLAQRSSRWRGVDALALTLVTVAVNLATGAPGRLTVFFVVANLVQAYVFTFLFARWLPHLWGGGGDRPLARLHDLWRVIAVAFVSTLCGTLIGPTGIWLVNGAYSWSAAAVWLTRNTVSVLLIGVAGIRLGYVVYTHLSRRGDGARVPLRARWAALPGRTRAEYVAVTALSAASYLAVFGLDHNLPLAFTVIAMTVWAALRLHTGFVIVHDVAFGSAAVLFTLHGDGVFAHIASHPARALVAQVFVGMITVIGLVLALSRDERVALAEERASLIEGLREAQQAATRQATLLGTIVDSMAEGLTVVDDQGRFLLRNPAVRDLLGGVVSTSGSFAQPGFYGLFHPDGSPLAPEEMPYRRALAGRDVHGMDIFVRNPGVPDGRVLSVSSTALTDDLDTRYAVTVFHDVTAERRHRDELASFAGVVAHDLLNPLATIEGWTEALTEVFAETPGHPAAEEAADAVVRIKRSAIRMRNLINDLLGYTTARDAEIAPAEVDLGEVVADIVAARVDQAQSHGIPAPEFHVGELHTVYADPVLVRQLLDNLVSNAIKYTAPGVTSAISITSDTSDGGDGGDGEDGGGVVTVTVTDNGIGIPAGQHHNIFDNFHRAHRSAGYTGTGLGLGICKRIVERHGGTIRADDNPDGPGSRFVFTLPADAPAAAEAATPEREHPPGVPDAGGPDRPVEDVPAPEPPEAGLPAPAPGAGFDHAARLVLDYLHDQLPLAFWAVTRVANGRQTYLYLDADNGYGLRQGESHPWEDSFCVHMAAGHAPAVALDAQAVPAYAQSRVNENLDIGTYAGAVINDPDGALFGAICGLDPHARPGDPRMAAAEPLLALLGRLLTAVLAIERSRDRAAKALLLEELSTESDRDTGLPNRRAWHRLIAHAQARYARLADPTVIAVLRLDELWAFDDDGRAAYVRDTATAVRRAVRDGDIIARIDEDELGLLLPDCNEADAETVIARIHTELRFAGTAASVGWTAVTPDRGLPALVADAENRREPSAPVPHRPE
ncbi:ATP-binding protein [Jidongwangia harbinensis]|uniref:ATP-binding protein n=1 Tax=Jidongwangia harbinensis TaxID=2878561 RepID=UPI002342D392|nr:ATP-binding protein [Jidongwangia harbinensis]